ncbi:hypothetical protein ACQ86N_27405 [Puia sp. P3]|uniref:hypothetical protein n=1 Tax=Puia sp. P3 TaxID=3423952 RepID=UPI003D673F51
MPTETSSNRASKARTSPAQASVSNGTSSSSTKAATNGSEIISPAAATARTIPWIHEGFTKYTEVLYTEYVHGPDAAETYYQGLLHRIKNDRPAMQGGNDKYYKGAAFLHAVRHTTGTPTFRALLHSLNSTFYHQSVSTSQILTFINSFTHHNFTPLFDQYMRTTQWPID